MHVVYGEARASFGRVCASNRLGAMRTDPIECDVKEGGGACDRSSRRLAGVLLPYAPEDELVVTV